MGRAKAVVKKLLLKAKAVFLKVGKSIKKHAKLMKIKVHVRPKDCKCAPKKAHAKVVKGKKVIKAKVVKGKKVLKAKVVKGKKVIKAKVVKGKKIAVKGKK